MRTFWGAWIALTEPIRAWWRTFCAEALKEATGGQVIADAVAERPLPKDGEKSRDKPTRPFRLHLSQSQRAASWEYRQTDGYKRAQADLARRKEAENHGHDDEKR